MAPLQLIATAPLAAILLVVLLFHRYRRILLERNELRRRWVLNSLNTDDISDSFSSSISTSARSGRRTIVGFFHPYCNAGGGGERVLWAAVSCLQKDDPEAIVVVYTGDVTTSSTSKQDILDNVLKRFNIDLDPETILFLPLYKRHLVEPSTWPRFTLLGQSLGSVVLCYEAMSQGLIPDVFIDTMGYAFTYPLVALLAPAVPIGSYTHYPTITTTMLERVRNRTATHSNPASVAQSNVKSAIKLLYYNIFASCYAYSLRHATVMMVNSSWTQAHIRDFLPVSPATSSSASSSSSGVPPKEPIEKPVHDTLPVTAAVSPRTPPATPLRNRSSIASPSSANGRSHFSHPTSTPSLSPQSRIPSPIPSPDRHHPSNLSFNKASTLLSLPRGSITNIASASRRSSPFFGKRTHRKTKPVQAHLLYPPVSTGSLSEIPLTGSREKIILSVAQFRPEKEHEVQLRAFEMFLKARREKGKGKEVEDIKLVMVGSVRGKDDEARVEKLKILARDLKLQDKVQFVVNASYSELAAWYCRSWVGLHTMVDEHFGITVVEFLAAGLIPLTHASAGPLLDIVVPYRGLPTGYHALTTTDFADKLDVIFSMSSEEDQAMRKRARASVGERFGDGVFENGWRVRWEELSKELVERERELY